MPTIEEVFLNTKEILTKQIEEAVQEAIGQIYYQYLPYVENDTTSNVYFQAYEFIEAFFNDTLGDEHVKFDPTRRFSSEKARQLIYERNKEEIQAAIGKDLQDKIDRLEAQLKEAYRNY